MSFLTKVALQEELKREADTVGKIVATALSWIPFKKITIQNNVVYIECGLVGKLKWFFCFNLRRETNLLLKEAEMTLKFGRKP